MLLTIEQFCPVEVIKVGKRKPEIIAVRRPYSIEVLQVASQQIVMSLRWSNAAHMFGATSGERFAVGEAGCFETIDPKTLSANANWLTRTGEDNDVPWPDGSNATDLFLNEMPEVRQVVRDYSAEVASALQSLADTMVTDGRRILGTSVEPRWEVHCQVDGRFNMFQCSITAPKLDSVTVDAFRFDDLEGALDFAVARGAPETIRAVHKPKIEVPRPELLHFDPQQFHALATARHLLWMTVGHLPDLTTPQLTAYGVLRDKVREWQKAPFEAPIPDVSAAVEEAWVDLSSAVFNPYRAVQEGHRRIIESVIGVQQSSEDEFAGLSGP